MSVTDPNGDGLERVQQILYGDFARRTQERIDVVEQGFFDALSDLRTEFEQRLSQLEQLLGEEISTGLAQLETRLTTEAERQFAELAGTLENEAKERAAADSTLTATVDQCRSTLTEALHDAAATAAADLDARAGELADAIDRTAADLDTAKVGREELGDALLGVAKLLNGGRPGDGQPPDEGQ